MLRPPRLSAALLPILAALAAPAAALSPEAELLARYVRLDTSNPPGNERAAAELLARHLRDAGVATELYVSPRGRASLAARLPASRPDAPVVVLLHHLDVVPPGEGWSGPAFSGEVREGKLWGRGAIDAKSLGVAQLAAFLAARAQPERRRELLLLAVADEEAGGAEGTRWLLERHPELFARAEAVLNEGGQNRTVLGRTLFWGVEVVQKRPLWLRVSARGRPGHAAAINVESAAHRLILALARALETPPRWRVSPAARAYFEALAAFDPHARAVAADFDGLFGPAGPTRALLPGMAGYFLDSFQVTRLSASDRVNVVAAEASAEVDVRLLPDTDAEAWLADLRRRLGDDVDVEVELAAPPTPPSPSDTPLFAEIARALGGGAPVVPAFIAGVTDSRHFRERGIAAYGLSPFALEAADSGSVHGPDERIPLDVFDQGVERMKKIVRALVAPDGQER